MGGKIESAVASAPFRAAAGCCRVGRWLAGAGGGFVAVTALLGVLTGLPDALSGLPRGVAGEEPHPPLRFGEHVRPVLRERCASCHAGDKDRGGFFMETRADLLEGGDSGPVVVPGSSATSRLIAIVSGEDPDLVMPPKGDRLTKEEVAVLKLWIEQGAPWAEEEGSLLEGPAAAPKTARPVTPRRPEIPPATAELSHPIDRLVGAYFEEHGVQPAPVVDDRTFLRRLSLDVTGLLPSRGDIEAFLSDTGEDKRARWVRKLLDRKTAYAEHWLSFWNDLLRNDYEGPGYIDGGRRQITQWLYRSLVENKPYDRFTRELLRPTPESEGFSYGIRWRGRVNASQVRELQFSQNVSQVFLGINMKCASCHDSFIDEWKLDDAYGLAAVYAEAPLEIHRCDIPTGETARARFPFPELGEIDPSAPRDERLTRLAELMTSPQNGRFARTVVNRLWARLMGRGIIEPLDAMDNEPFSLDLLDFLASDLIEHGYDLKHAIERIATSTVYQRRCAPLEEDNPKAFVFRGPSLKRMTAEQLVDAVWAITETAPEAADVRLERGEDGATARPVRASLKKADALTRSLGRPNREQVVSSRPEAMSTLMALELTNGETLAGLLERGARALRARHDSSSIAIVEEVFLRALARPPGPQERALALGLLGETAADGSVADFLWAVLMLPEFQLVH